MINFNSMLAALSLFRIFWRFGICKSLMEATFVFCNVFLVAFGNFKLLKQENLVVGHVWIVVPLVLFVPF